MIKAIDTGEWLAYAEYYPDIDEKGYDGVHAGGVKGLKPDAPEWAKKAYDAVKKAEKKGFKI